VIERLTESAQWKFFGVLPISMDFIAAGMQQPPGGVRDSK
jgi:hypothetical protein